MEKEFDLENKKVKEVWTKYSDYDEKRWADFDEHHAKWTTKVKDFFVYSIGWNLRYWWYDTKWFFRNIRKFLKLAKDWRPWDYNYQVDLFKFGLTELADYMDRYGHEVDVTRTKKIAAIRELVEELGRDYEDEVSEKYGRHDAFGESVKQIVEYEDGSVMFDFKEDEETKKKEKEYEEAVVQARKEHYDKIHRLIVGQDMEQLYEESNAKFAALPPEEQEDPHYTKRHEIYAELFDGTGLEGWWD